MRTPDKCNKMSSSFTNTDIEEMWGKFILMFNQAEKEFIPKKVVKTGKRKFSHSIDKKTLSKRKKKYTLWKRYLESRDANVYEEYCRCRNQIRRLTRQGIKVYERKQKNLEKTAKFFGNIATQRSKCVRQFQSCIRQINMIHRK